MGQKQIHKMFRRFGGSPLCGAVTRRKYAGVETSIFRMSIVASTVVPTTSGPRR